MTDTMTCSNDLRIKGSIISPDDTDVAKLFSVIHEDNLYASLQRVLHNAYRQAAVGKGKERHADGEERFEHQQIVEIGKRLQGNAAAGPLFQAVKKIYESGRLDADRAIHELLGAINYCAAAIIIRQAEIQEGEKQ